MEEALLQTSSCFEASETMQSHVDKQLQKFRVDIVECREQAAKQKSVNDETQEAIERLTSAQKLL